MNKKIICTSILSLFILSGASSLSAVAESIDAGIGNFLYVGGSGPGNYSKIQDAIDNSIDGDNVFVYDDSSPYYENVVVTKSISLIGEDKNTTVIDGNDLSYAIKLSADNVKINGFTIQNAKNVGIDLHSSYNVIIGNIIKNCGEDDGKAIGKYLEGGKPEYNTIAENTLIDNNAGIIVRGIPILLTNYTIINNTILNCYTTGIVIDGTEDCVISGNTIMNHNLMGDERCSGIYVTYLCIRNIISGNTVVSPANGCKGIMIDEDCYQNSIYDNTIKDHTWGIYLGCGSNYNQIYENNVVNNDNGIYVTGGGWGDVTGNIFSENTITNNDYGINLDAQAYNIKANAFSSNLIKENTYGIYCVINGGVRVGETTDNTITENSFIQNGYGLYSNKYFFDNIIYRNNFISSSQSNAYSTRNNFWDNNGKGNYWDDYIGLLIPRFFDMDQDGIGKIPYRKIQPCLYNFLSGNKDRCPLMKPCGDENNKNSAKTNLGLEKNDEYIPRDPIYITSDDDFTAENGVTGGSGTEADPFVIYNWDVSNIRVSDVTKFFIINHCYINVDNYGITFRNVVSGKVKDCMILLNEYGTGICLVDSNNNLIEDCFISASNDGTGIDFSYSNYNTICGCNIEKCKYAIYLGGRDGSHNNIICCCNISGCTDGAGISLFQSGNNKIYHNNFYENYFITKPIKIRCNAEVYGGINQWDNSIEGNYWDNYIGLRFPRFCDRNNDGIGELPYRILDNPFPWGRPSGNKDRHPLMKPYNEN